MKAVLEVIKCDKGLYLINIRGGKELLFTKRVRSKNFDEALIKGKKYMEKFITMEFECLDT